MRWTRVCFCGQTVAGGKVASKAEVGLPFFTGSEEGRGPLYDVTHEHYEGRHQPISVGPQGDKIGVSGVPGDVPTAVPLLAIRVGDGLIASIPGEATKEVGARTRAAIGSAIAGSGIAHVAISGLANEYLSYFTTPEEYERQHYEGGQTYFGKLSSVLIEQQLATLSGHLVRGEPAQGAYPLDPTHGVAPDGPPYPPGALRGTVLEQPARAYSHLTRANFAWQGGAKGLDRRVDGAFVVVQRRKRGRWRRVTSDLGVQILWSVDDNGRYRARWEIPLTARRGRYRIVVIAKRYRLNSRSFQVVGSRALQPRKVPAAAGRVAVVLGYPAAVMDVDLTWRPVRAHGGVVRFRVGRRTVKVKRKRSAVFSVRAPAGAGVTIPAGSARDRFGNRNRSAFRVR
jgi:hypothetical protein